MRVDHSKSTTSHHALVAEGVAKRGVVHCRAPTPTLVVRYRSLEVDIRVNSAALVVGPN